jgi:hypothetical protein
MEFIFMLITPVNSPYDFGFPRSKYLSRTAFLDWNRGQQSLISRNRTGGFLSYTIPIKIPTLVKCVPFYFVILMLLIIY